MIFNKKKKEDPIDYLFLPVGRVSNLFYDGEYKFFHQSATNSLTEISFIEYEMFKLASFKMNDETLVKYLENLNSDKLREKRKDMFGSYNLVDSSILVSAVESGKNKGMFVTLTDDFNLVSNFRYVPKHIGNEHDTLTYSLSDDDYVVLLKNNEEVRAYMHVFETIFLDIINNFTLEYKLIDIRTFEEFVADGVFKKYNLKPTDTEFINDVYLFIVTLIEKQLIEIVLNN